ncbi:MAG: hypothetical protein HC879_10825 [Leptolyngbyaceae cyanobacterium SL_5_9]|nr:hypothetical protein [Leptolyngbyaceae cyanobacterium SL_5_9]NJO73939.1 hypothetical protein [Leptolyngbyaceae cyanobacterium RM1_406_9]
MSLLVVFRGEAQAEFDKAFDWYEQQKETRCATFPNPLTLNPSPRAEEGLRATLAPLLPTWELIL